MLLTDIDECGSNETSRCSPHATCTNIPGSFVCVCGIGYDGNGLTCTGMPIFVEIAHKSIVERPRCSITAIEVLIGNRRYQV